MVSNYSRIHRFYVAFDFFFKKNVAFDLYDFFLYYYLLAGHGIGIQYYRINYKYIINNLILLFLSNHLSIIFIWTYMFVSGLTILCCINSNKIVHLSLCNSYRVYPQVFMFGLFVLCYYHVDTIMTQYTLFTSRYTCSCFYAITRRKHL